MPKATTNARFGMMREQVKSVLGSTVSRLSRQADYKRCLFIIAHMRCGSTALSNILCTRGDVSGYGEAHIRYNTPNAVGRLMINQALRNSWSPRAAILFDKILHNRHDCEATDGFFLARAIFLAREPHASVASIVSLYQRLGKSREYPDASAAARYYIDRLDHMCLLWDQYPVERRVGLTHEMLVRDPDAALARISKSLRITPALENRYVSRRVSRKGGAGDPLVSGSHNRIEAGRKQEARVVGSLPDSLETALDAAYRRYLDLIEQNEK